MRLKLLVTSVLASSVPTSLPRKAQSSSEIGAGLAKPLGALLPEPDFFLFCYVFSEDFAVFWSLLGVVFALSQ